VRGAGGKLRFEIIFHCEPLVLEIDFATPAADAEKTFEIIKPLQQAHGHKMHPDPNQNDDAGAEGGAMPVGSEWLVIKVMGDAEKLGEPGHQNQKRKAGAFDPKDGVPSLFGFLHAILICAQGKTLSSKSVCTATLRGGAKGIDG